MATYAYSPGDGLAVLDASTPNGAVEPVAILDDAVRQIKAYLKDPTVGPEAIASAAVAAANPPGTGKIYFGGAIPTGYLACDGSAVSRVDYAALFAAIGTTWGAGDGSTTFNVPDFRGRFPLGEGQGNAPDATAWSFGQTAGTEQHTLTIGQMPVHDHQYEKYGSLTGVGGANPIWANTGTGVTAGAGGGQPHNNMPPLLVVKFIIKT